jgi:DNA-binding HxlR family transcriptional regulator
MLNMRVAKEIAELKNEIIKFRNETKQHLDIIEHELNKHIALNYIHAIVKYMTCNVGDFIKSLKCQEKIQDEVECKEEILTAQQKYLDRLRKANFPEARKALTELIDLTKNIKQKMKEKGKENCVSCCSRQVNMLMLNMSLVDELNVLCTQFSLDEDKIKLVSNIEPLKLTENVLNPISHEARLKIMLSIFKGNGRFAHFIRITGLNGGHLLYHLNKLKKHGFIHQYSSKDYGLTKKGMKTLLLLAQLNEEKQDL